MKTVTEITWKFYYPPEFDCMISGCKERATKAVRITIDNNPYFELNLVLCPECAELPEQDLAMAFISVRKEGE